MTIPKIIHQVFLDIGTPLKDFPIFIAGQEKWKSWCEENGYEYKFWTSDTIERRLQFDKSIYDFYYELRYTWQRIDFIRYVLLNYYGGVYIDLDVHPLPRTILKMVNFDKYITSQDYILGSWYNTKTKKWEITNGVMGFEATKLTSLINYSIEQVEEKSKLDIYKKWKIRFMLQTTGVRMFKRWCKHKKYDRSEDLYTYVKDYATATWLSNFK